MLPLVSRTYKKKNVEKQVVLQMTCNSLHLNVLYNLWTIMDADLKLEEATPDALVTCEN